MFSFAIIGWSLVALFGLAFTTFALDVRRGLKNWE